MVHRFLSAPGAADSSREQAPVVDLSDGVVDGVRLAHSFTAQFVIAIFKMSSQFRDDLPLFGRGSAPAKVDRTHALANQCRPIRHRLLRPGSRAPGRRRATPVAMAPVVPCPWG